MRITTLILSFLAFIFVLILAPVARAETQTPEFQASFKLAHEQESNTVEKYEKKYSAVESGTSTILIVSNAMISLLIDDDGDEEYPKMTCKLDLDASETIDYYVIFYLNFSTYGGGWFTFDDLETDVYTLEKGYSPSEGLFYLDLYFISGYGSMKVDIKAEVYYTNGSLAATYGPDDDPDLKNIPAESADYDAKEDPFATPSPTPTPTPEEEKTPKIIGQVVDTNNNSIFGAKATLKNSDGEVVSTASSDENGEFEMENLEYGRYKLYLSKKGYRKKSITVTVDENTGTENVTIRLKRR